MPVLLALLAALVLAAPAAAAPIVPLGGQLQLTSGEPGVESEAPSIAFDPGRNRFLLVYEGPGEAVSGRFLDPSGAPLGAPFSLFTEEEPVVGAPAVVYDAVRDQYLAAFSGRTADLPEAEVWATRVAGAGGVLSTNRITDYSADESARVGDVALAVATTGNSACPFMAAYTAAPGPFSEGEVYTHLISTAGVDCGNSLEHDFDSEGDGQHPALAFLPGDPAFQLVWSEGPLGEATIELEHLQLNNTRHAGGHETVPAPDGSESYDPDITVTGDDEFLIAYQMHPQGGHRQVWTLAYDGDRNPVAGGPHQLSFDGDADAQDEEGENARLAWNAELGLALVSWQQWGDDVPGHEGTERQDRVGRPVTAAGAPVAGTFAISDVGGAYDANRTRSAGRVAAFGRRWLHVFGAEAPALGLPAEQQEVFGRIVGEDLDLDDDGVPTPADCDDANPAIPGTEVPGNGVDDDCVGGDAAAGPSLTAATLSYRFVKGRRTRVAKLRVLNAPLGMSIQIRCKTRKRCPKKLRKTRKLSVSAPGTVDLRSRVGKRFKPRARLRVRLVEGGKIGREYRFRMRKRKLPRLSALCLPVGGAAGPCA